MKEKILSIVPEAILEEKHGIWFVSVPRTSFHDLALRLRNDEDTSFDFLVCMTGMDWGETLGVMYHLRSSKYGHDLALRVETAEKGNNIKLQQSRKPGESRIAECLGHLGYSQPQRT